MKKLNWLSIALAVIVLIFVGWFFVGVQSPVIDEPIIEEVEETQEVVQVEFSVDDFSSSVELEPGTSALALMNQLAEDNSDFSFSGSDSEFGFFVEEINGVENDTENNMYWSMYANDELAQFGVSDYIVADGDKLDWRYEEVTF